MAGDDDVKVVKGSEVPDFFADEAMSFEHINGTIRISLASAQMVEPSPPSPTQLAIIGRLIMPPESAMRLAVGLYDYLEKVGYDPKQVVGNPGDAEPGKAN